MTAAAASPAAGEPVIGGCRMSYGVFLIQLAVNNRTAFSILGAGPGTTTLPPWLRSSPEQPGHAWDWHINYTLPRSVAPSPAGQPLLLSISTAPRGSRVLLAFIGRAASARPSPRSCVGQAVTLDAFLLPPPSDFCLRVTRLSGLLQGRWGLGTLTAWRRDPLTPAAPRDTQVWVIFLHVITAASPLSLGHK